MKKSILGIVGVMMVALAFIGCTHTRDSSSANGKQEEIMVRITRDGGMSVAGESCRRSEVVDKSMRLASVLRVK